MAEKKSRLLYLGSALREAGVLIAVFGPMYQKFDSKVYGWVLLWNVALWIFVGISTFWLGMEIERRQ